MATYQAQIEGLTSLTIDTAPTTAEVTQYLVDGVKEVANRILLVKPIETPRFCNTTTSSSTIAQTGALYSVVREEEGGSVLRKCDPIDPSLRYEATDVDSFQYRSKHNPGYYVLDDIIHSVPIADAVALQVTQVQYDTDITFASSAVSFMPSEYEYLVALYASMRSLQNKMGSLSENSDITTAIANANTALDRISSSLYNGIDNYDEAHKRFKQVKVALDNASKLFNGDFPNSLSDTESYLKMEDPEMIEASLTSIQTEASVAEKVLTELNVMVDLPLKESQGFMAEVSSRLGLLSQDYNWYNAKYKELKSEYDGAFMIMAPQQRGGNES